MKHYNACIDKKEIEAILDLYSKGYSQTYIAIKMRRTKQDIKIVIKNAIGKTNEVKYNASFSKEPRILTKDEMERLAIIDDYKAGVTEDEIKKKYNIKDVYLNSILVGARLKNHKVDGVVRVSDVEKFRDEMIIGDTYYLPQEIYSPYSSYPIVSGRTFTEVTILEKYPYIVYTDHGYFQYADIIFGDRRYRNEMNPDMADI